MKNKVIFTFIYLLFKHSTFCQIGINSDNTAPHPSAQLDVKSANKGLLLPRVISPNTTVASPAAGLMVYDQANANLAYYNGSQWSSLNGTAGNTGLYSRFPNSMSYRGEINNSATTYTEYSFIVPAGIT